MPGAPSPCASLWSSNPKAGAAHLLPLGGDSHPRAAATNKARGRGRILGVPTGIGWPAANRCAIDASHRPISARCARSVEPQGVLIPDDLAPPAEKTLASPRGFEPRSPPNPLI